MSSPRSARPLLIHRALAEHKVITHVEGRPLTAPASVRVLGEAEAMIVIEVTMPAGQSSPEHVHDHESVGYVVSGRVRAEVGGVVEELTAGDGFVHPIGVPHSIHAISDSPAVWLEVKSPPRRTW